MASNYPESGNAPWASRILRILLHFVPVLRMTPRARSRKSQGSDRAAKSGLARLENKGKKKMILVNGDIDMTISDAGIAFIEHWEVPRLHVYDDGFGNPTIGCGHLWKRGDPTVIDSKQMEAYLQEDLAIVEARLHDQLHVQLRQHQYDALVSLFFNVGVLWITQGSVVRKCNARDWKRAAATILEYDKANGKKTLGLVRRRHAERRMFLEGIY